MAFQQGLSGLNSSSKALDVISNNVANASTVGFKSAGTVFGDVYAASLSGAVSKVQVGIGSSVMAVRQTFSQGNMVTTSNPLDMAINGNGFFEIELQGGEQRVLTRNGQFSVDVNGNIVTALGDKLIGYQTTDPASGDLIAPEIPTDAVRGAITIPLKGASAVATSNVELSLNLSADAVPTNLRPAAPLTAASMAADIDITNSDDYDYATALKVFDSLGKEHTLSFYFVRRTDSFSPGDAAAVPPVPAAYSEWDIYTVLDNEETTLAYNSTMNFDGMGELVSVTNVVDGTTLPGMATSIAAVFPVASDAVSPTAMQINLDELTQFGGASVARTLSQDGAAKGELAGLSVSSDGTIQARYTNGVTKALAIVNITTVRNSNGLSPLGNNYWAQTPESGVFTPGVPGDGLNGVISAGQVEESNVDLTQELVQMIIQQRNYQANAQSIRTQDQILQTLVNLR